MAPLFGYNTNLRHGGVLYHIQTEDSGKEWAHIITHIFVDGGKILDSRRLEYSETLSEPGWKQRVRKLMQAQHKAMCIAIRDGNYDTVSNTTATPSPPSGSANPARLHHKETLADAIMRHALEDLGPVNE